MTVELKGTRVLQIHFKKNSLINQYVFT